MTYFKYGFLNSLRDELGLTMTRQRVTVFHVASLALPMAGLGAGIAWGTRTHSIPTSVIGSASGLVIGGILAWLLPRVLWNMLRLLARKGWCIQPDAQVGVDPMTPDQFIARSKVLRRNDHVWLFMWLGLIIAWALVFQRLCFYLDKQAPQAPSPIVGIIGFLAVLLGLSALRRRVRLTLLRKIGLLCPTCKREITDAAGLSRVPQLGLCKHCGTKVVEL